jgi:hypothetical protein
MPEEREYVGIHPNFPDGEKCGGRVYKFDDDIHVCEQCNMPVELELHSEDKNYFQMSRNGDKFMRESIRVAKSKL